MSLVTLNYTLTFHTDWHSGSGQSRGADVDALVVKDAMGLPFVPGKVIKGLAREAMEEIMFLQGKDADAGYRQIVIDFLGNSADRNLKPTQEEKSYECMARGCGFFSNAVLEKSVAQAIVQNEVQRFLFREISRTKINTEGIAEDHSLRKMEVAVPCTLTGTIHDVPAELETDLRQALGYIKRMGLGRNRGLGRCTIRISEGGTL